MSITVQRIQTENGSHIEPPLNSMWTNLQQLQWHLAVVLLDANAGADLITVEEAHYTSGGVPQESYVIRYPGGLITSGSHFPTWTLISGIGVGLRSAEVDALREAGER